MGGTLTIAGVFRVSVCSVLLPFGWGGTGMGFGGCWWVRCWVLRERAGPSSGGGLGLVVVSSWAGVVHTVTRGCGGWAVVAGGGFVV